MLSYIQQIKLYKQIQFVTKLKYYFSFTNELGTPPKWVHGAMHWKYRKA